MRYSRIASCGVFGIKGVRVDIEVSLLPGISSFEIVGLGDSAIRESRNRVHAAIKNSGYDFPGGRIIVSMAPAFIRKHGTSYDLPVAVGILSASRQIRSLPEDLCVTGELSLNGEVRGVPGIVSRILTAVSEGFGRMMIPSEDLGYSAFSEGMKIYGVKNLIECSSLISMKEPWPDTVCKEILQNRISEKQYRDISEIVGQSGAVAAVQYAAAGWHNMMMTGSPGCGKTSIAETLPGILPELGNAERTEVAMIYSLCGSNPKKYDHISARPFRNPHHSITKAAMTGGGQEPMPGEMTLAHKGVLFLDEINEFRPDVLDNLRQPLEEHRIKLSRQKYQVEFPADFILIAAGNPCKCGNLLERDINRPCRCSSQNIERYTSVISGSLADRIDIFVDMIRIPSNELERSISHSSSPASSEISNNVKLAWERQFSRCIKHGLEPCYNSRIPSAQIRKTFDFDDDFNDFARTAVDRLELSVRSYQKMIRLARSIADYEGDDKLRPEHLARALQFRRKT